jgi:hypothetical protein
MVKSKLKTVFKSFTLSQPYLLEILSASIKLSEWPGRNWHGHHLYYHTDPVSTTSMTSNCSAFEIGNWPVLRLPWSVLMVLFWTMTLFNSLGPSAWQNWTYEVKVYSQDILEITQVFSNISGTMLNVPELQSSTKYTVSVRASSPKGPGPWSAPSVGTTLVPGKKRVWV